MPPRPPVGRSFISRDGETWQDLRTKAVSGHPTSASRRSSIRSAAGPARPAGGAQPASAHPGAGRAPFHAHRPGVIRAQHRGAVLVRDARGRALRQPDPRPRPSTSATVAVRRAPGRRLQIVARAWDVAGHRSVLSARSCGSASAGDFHAAAGLCARMRPGESGELTTQTAEPDHLAGPLGGCGAAGGRPARGRGRARGLAGRATSRRRRRHGYAGLALAASPETVTAGDRATLTVRVPDDPRRDTPAQPRGRGSHQLPRRPVARDGRPWRRQLSCPSGHDDDLPRGVRWRRRAVAARLGR